MYKLQVSTKAGYRIAIFYAGSTMREANAFYYDFMRSELYAGHIITIKEA